MRLWLSVALLAAGCSHPLMLKKYSATTPKRTGIEGRTVFVAPFADRREEDWDDKKSVALPEPKGFEYREPTSEQMDAWEAERDKLEQSRPLAQWYRVGHMRNAFGAPIKEVFSVTPPADWLTDAARIELTAQGATMGVEGPDADLVVQAVLRYAWLDLYMATWVHLVLDVTTTVRGQPPETVRIHASEGKLAWSGSETESFGIYTATEQKLSRYLVDHVARELGSPGALVPPAPP